MSQGFFRKRYSSDERQVAAMFSEIDLAIWPGMRRLACDSAPAPLHKNALPGAGRWVLPAIRQRAQPAGTSGLSA